MIDLAFKRKDELFGWVAGGGLEYKLFEHVRSAASICTMTSARASYAFQPFLTHQHEDHVTTSPAAL